MNIFIKSILPVLLLWSTGLWAQADDPFPDVKTHDYYGNMMMSVKVVTSGITLTEDVIVAVYSGDEIRGKGFPQDPDNPGVTYMTVYGNSTGEQLTFKVYAKGVMVEPGQGISYTFNGSLGTPYSPYILDISTSVPYSGITILTSEGKQTAVFDGNSGETISIPLPLTVDAIQYNRTFIPGQPAAVILPFDINASMTVTGCKLYSFDHVEYEDPKWVATLLRANVLNANTPYVVMPENEHISIDFGGKLISLMTEAKIPISKNGWTFYGTYEMIVWTAEGNDYGFPANNPDVSQQEFKRFTAGDYILPLHCYLSYTGDNAPAARRAPAIPAARRVSTIPADLPDRIELRFVDGEEEGVVLLDYTPQSSRSAWFTLDGRKLGVGEDSSPQAPIRKGIYIHDGRKVVIP